MTTNEATNGFTHNGKTYMVVRLELLRVDEAYQRQLSHKAVAVNSTEGVYDDRAMRCLTVSRRKDKLFWILDGLHRFHMAKERGLNELVCEIHDGLDRKTEASLFKLLNNTKPVAVNAKFKASLAAGDSQSKAIMSVVANEGYNVCFKTGRPDRGNIIRNIGTLEYVYETFGPVVLTETLRIIKACYAIGVSAQVDQVALKDIFLRGFAYFLFNNDKLTADDVITAMAGQTAPAFKQFVDGENPGVRGKDSMRGFAACVLRKVISHNKKLTKA